MAWCASTGEPNSPRGRQAFLRYARSNFSWCKQGMIRPLAAEIGGSEFPKLAVYQLFFKAGTYFVKCHAEGTMRMRNAMQASSLPSPEFRETEVKSGFNSVRVVLRNSIKLRKQWLDSEAVRVLGPRAANLLQSELRILNFVSEHGSINVTQSMRLL